MSFRIVPRAAKSTRRRQRPASLGWRRLRVEPLENRHLLSLIPTSTFLSASAISVNAGDPVTFAAIVAPLPPNSGTPGGTVDFIDASTHTSLGTASLSGGSASISYSGLAAGNHNVIAAYSGDADYQASATRAGPSSMITTVAGNGTLGYTGDGVPATQSSLLFPSDVAADGAGHLFIADRRNHRVRQVDLSTGIITTVAGNGTAGFSGDGGPATAAELDLPAQIEVDSTGHLFVFDLLNFRIRQVDLSTGIITTLAGNGTQGSSGDGGPAAAAQVDATAGMAVDAAGEHLFISDVYANRVRDVNLSTGIITTVAGKGTVGFSGDGGPAIAAELNGPGGLALDAAGEQLFISDRENRRVRRVDLSTGVITTVAGNGSKESGGDGGQATAAALSPGGLAVDAAGRLFIADGRHVREVDLATGVIRTVAGHADGRVGYEGDGGPATDARFNYVEGLAADSTGHLFIADLAIREVDLSTGVISTVAGGYNADGGLATDAPLDLAEPWLLGLAVDASGHLFVTVPNLDVVREVDLFTGLISTVAGGGGLLGDGGPATDGELGNPGAVAVDAAGHLFIAGTWQDRVRQVDLSTGTITTVAGNGKVGYSGDGGQATAAKVSGPAALAVDAAGHLFIAGGYDVIREVDLATGVIRTVAGNGSSYFGGDGGSATSAGLFAPSGIAVDTAGQHLFIADLHAQRIREVDLATGLITTIAGNPADCGVWPNWVAGYGGDGGPATAAQLSGPRHLALDATGHLFIADLGNNRIREVDLSTGVITTVAGNGTAGYSGDGGQAGAAELNGPMGVAVDAAGNLFIADWGNNRIRQVVSGVQVVVSQIADTRTTPVVSVAAVGGTYTGWGFSATSTLVDATGTVRSSLEGVTPTLTYYVGTTASGSGSAVAPAAVGTYTVVASFPGSAHYAPAESPPATFSITQAVPTVAVSNAGGPYDGLAFPATAAVAGVAAGVDTTPAASLEGVSPTFTYYVGNTASGDGSSDVPSAMGTYTVVAAFPGSADYTPAQSLPVTFTIGPPVVVATEIAVAASANTVALGEAVTLTATVTVAPPRPTQPDGGTVTFMDGGTVLATVPLSAGTAAYTTSLLALGPHLLTAEYSGDGVKWLGGDTSRIIAPVAGDGTARFSGDGGQALAASFNSPRSVALDAAGRLFVADANNNRVRVVDLSTGLTTTVAGTGVSGYSGDGGQATAAQLNWPSAVVVDGNGHLFIADSNNHRVRQVDLATGVISTVAGNGMRGCSGDEGPATAAAISRPTQMALDGSGHLFITDSDNHRIREVNLATGVITTVAGNGSGGYSGDGGPATAAQLYVPMGVAVDAAGHLFIADYGNNVIRQVDLFTGTTTTLVGNGTQGYSGDGGRAIAAALDRPENLAVDASGNLFVADLGNRRIREVHVASGAITTIAGNGAYGYGGNGGPATAAELVPGGFAMDAGGNLFVADTSHNRIRRISSDLRVTVTEAGAQPAPTVTVSAAGGTYNNSPFPATATVAGVVPGLDRIPASSLEGVSPTFTYYAGTSVDGAGSPIAPRVAGTYTVVASFAGSADYAATESAPVTFTIARARPWVMVSGAGGIYNGSPFPATAAVAGVVPGYDTAPSLELERVAPTLTYYVGPTASGSGSPDAPSAVGTYTVVASFAGSANYAPVQTVPLTYKILPKIPNVSIAVSDSWVVAGQPVTFTVIVAAPSGSTGIPTGTVEFSDAAAQTSLGTASLSGGTATLSTSTLAPGLHRITASYSGDADFQPAVTVIGPSSTITTIAGGNNTVQGDGGPATAARVVPVGVAVDGNGHLFIADRSYVRQVDLASGLIETIGSDLYGPAGVAVGSNGSVYVADQARHAIRQVDLSTGAISRIAGSGTDWGYGYGGDGGKATAAYLYSPSAVALDGNGHLFIADTRNNRVRAVDLASGVITTVAGNGTAGYSGDGGQATAAGIWGPQGVAVDAAGHLFIADTRNNRVRAVDLASGVITTVAGGGTAGYRGDGGQAIFARLSAPTGLAVDASGNLFIVDSGNQRIREVDPVTGLITTVAGNGAAAYSGEGGPAVAAALNNPTALAMDAGGNLFIADKGNVRVRELANGVLVNILSAKATPTIAIAAPGGTYHNVPYGATATVAGVVDGVDTTPASSLEGVRPTLTYYVGTSVSGSGFSAAPVAAGTYTAVASFAGTAHYAAVQSDPVTFTIGQVTPVVAVGDAGGIYTGAAFPATATVAGVVPGLDSTPAASLEGVSPTVTYYVGARVSGSGSSVAPSAVGTYTVTAFFPGSANYGAATSKPATFTIAAPKLPATRLALAASATSLVRGQPMTFTATVVPVVAAQITPTGTVDFFDATTHVNLGQASLVGGIATFSTSALSAGRHVITATYSGDGDFSASTVSVGPGSTITSLAGNGYGWVNNDGGQALAAGLGDPAGLALDDAGHLFIADGDCRVRQVDLATGVIATVAGNGSTGPWGDGGPATAATLYSPTGVAVDAEGHLLIADQRNHRIRQVDLTTGVITSIVGTGTLGFSGDGGPASSAVLNSPTGVAVDDAGHLFIADRDNQRVREVDLVTGVITTVAGNGTRGFRGDGGPAIAAMLDTPAGIAVDDAGHLFIADTGNHRVRQVELSTGLISTVAGTSHAGYSGDGGAAIAAELNTPSRVAVAAGGHLFIADALNYRVREVDLSTGVITTIAGTGTVGYGGDGGPAAAAGLQPGGLALDAAGNLFVGDGHRVREILNGVQVLVSEPSAGVHISLTASAGSRTAGQPVTFAATVRPETTGASIPTGTVEFTDAATRTTLGTGSLSGGVATLSTSALTRGVHTITASYSGDVNFQASAMVIGPGSIITTVAGNGDRLYAGDGGPATSAAIASLSGVAVDQAGQHLFIADSTRNVVREVNLASGVITAVAGNGTPGDSGDGGQATAAQLTAPAGLAVAEGRLFIADYGNRRVRAVDLATGVITTVAGTGTYGFSGDGGQATAARLANPRGVAVDAAGHLFIADSYGYRVRQVDLATGLISTVAGNGTTGYAGDGSLATATGLCPYMVAVDPRGQLLILDQASVYDIRVRAVDLATGQITTVAGNGIIGYYGDGGPVAAAEFFGLAGIAADNAGNLFLADSSNGRIRQIDFAAGTVATLAGSGTRSYFGGFSGDGGPAGAAMLNGPGSIAADGAGNVYFADGGNYRVRQVLRGVQVVVNSASPLPAPTVTVSHAGGTYNGAPFPATATLTGMSGAPVPSLEAVAPICTYYSGTSVSGAGSTTAPVAAGTYTVMAFFPGSDNYAPAYSDPVTFHILAAGAPPLTLSIAASASTLTEGEFVTFTATVTPTAPTSDTPTGTVDFVDTTTRRNLGQVPLSAGVAILETATLAVGTHVITGRYSGDANFHSVTVNLGPESTITTVAGSGAAGQSGDGGPATAAVLGAPLGLAVDAAGHLFIASGGVRTVDLSTGVITTLVGNGTAGYDGDGGPAAAAELNGPNGLTVDRAGHLFIADSDNQRIREVDLATGIITTVAGNGTRGSAGDGGPATAAELYDPRDVAVDNAGHVFIAECSNHRVRAVDLATGIITTIAGNGTPGYGGDGGPAAAANLRYPRSIAVDGAGHLFIADVGNYAIRQVDLGTGVITTLVGDGNPGSSGDGGPAAAARIGGTTLTGGVIAIAADNAGHLFINDASNRRIRAVDLSSGLITTVAASSMVWSMAAEAGHLYVGDYRGWVRDIDPSTGTSTTIAGGGEQAGGGTGDGGPATAASLWNPAGIAVDAADNLFIADPSGQKVRKVDLFTGTITTVAGSGAVGYSGNGGPATAAALEDPTGVAVDRAGHLFIADTGNNVIREVDLATGRISTVAGTGTWGFGGDGQQATSAQLGHPSGVAVDNAGHLYIADCYNHRVRAVDLATGVITTVAGNGHVGSSWGDGITPQTGDGGPATAAELWYPRDVAVDAAGNLLIAQFNPVDPSAMPWDSASVSLVRHVNLSTGVINSLPGPTASGWYTPVGVAVDATGNVYIADDQANNQIWRFNLATGVLTNLTDGSRFAYAGDGGPAGAAALEHPVRVAVDPTGNLFIADSGNRRIREIVGTGGVRVTVSEIRIKATPTVTVRHPGGTYNGSPFPATASVTGAGGTPAASLESVRPTLIYYVGTSASGSGSAAAPVNAGTYTVVAAFAGSPGYTEAQSDPVTFTIAPKGLTITADNKSKVYWTPLPVWTASYSGFVAGDSIASLTTLPTFTTAATAESPAGTYAITAGGAVAANYAITYVAGTLTVLPSGWQNPVNPSDVTGEGPVTPLDVLIVINYINSHPGDTALPPPPATPPAFYDVSGDDVITPLDVLMVINYINAGGVGGSEGEWAASVAAREEGLEAALPAVPTVLQPAAGDNTGPNEQRMVCSSAISSLARPARGARVLERAIAADRLRAELPTWDDLLDVLAEDITRASAAD